MFEGESRLKNDEFWDALAGIAEKFRTFCDNAWKILGWMVLSSTGGVAVEAVGATPATVMMMLIPGTIGTGLLAFEMFSWLAANVPEKGRARGAIPTVFAALLFFGVSFVFATIVFVIVVSAAMQTVRVV